jgi:hypothetical protein
VVLQTRQRNGLIAKAVKKRRAKAKELKLHIARQATQTFDEYVLPTSLSLSIRYGHDRG